jgi:threonine synthase
LRCKECGTEYPASSTFTACEEDFGPLEVVYDYDAMRGKVTRASIEAGPRSLWRYRDLCRSTGRWPCPRRDTARG